MKYINTNINQPPLLREHPLMFSLFLYCSISNYFFLNFTREHAPRPSSDDSAFVSCLCVSPTMSIPPSANPGSVPEYFSGSQLECKLTIQCNVTGSVTLMTRLHLNGLVPVQCRAYHTSHQGTFSQLSTYHNHLLYHTAVKDHLTNIHHGHVNKRRFMLINIRLYLKPA